MPIRVTDGPGVGPPGPVGPVGPIAPGIEFIFRPGGVTAGRTYATWAALMADVTPVVLEPKTIFFDDTLGACTIPAGAYDLGKLTNFIGITPPVAGGNRVTLTMPNGVTLTRTPALIDHLLFLYTGAGNLITLPVGGILDRTQMRNSSRVQATGAGGVVWSAGAGSLFALQLLEAGCMLLTGAGLVLNATDATASIEIDAFTLATIQTNTLGSVAGAIFEIDVMDSSIPTVSTAQAAMPGGSIAGQIVLRSLAQGVAYTPAAPANWAPSPAVVSAALDQLADRSVGPVYIFRPGGVTAGNVFATWPALMTALAPHLNESKTIQFDDRLGACTVPVGAWAWGRNTTLLGDHPPLAAAGNRVEVTFVDGATVDMPPHWIETIQFTYAGTATLINVPADGRLYQTTMGQGARMRATNAAGTVVAVPGAATGWALNITRDATLVAGGGQIVNVAAAALTFSISIFEPLFGLATRVPANVLTGAAGPAYAFAAPTLGDTMVLAQAGMPGGVIVVTYFLTAANQPYTPATPTNWNPAPVSTGGALDQMGRIQGGVATLVAGVTAAIAANISANSRIVALLKNPNTTALTTDYAALAADRVNGSPGSFKLTALVAAGTINVNDISDLDWLVFGG